ncbi:MAG: hypothetical protein AB7D57_00755 [Desulfovibrionaceae bacterium]
MTGGERRYGAARIAGRLNGVGVAGFAPPPPDAGTGPAIVAGTGPDFVAEFLAARALAPRGAVLGVNGFGRDHGVHCDWWVSLHPEDFFARAERIPGTRPMTCADHACPGVDRLWPIPDGRGGSALLAVCIALAMGYGPVIVAGVRLEGGYAPLRAGWEAHARLLRGRVGTTAPDGTWIVRLLHGGKEATWPKAW